MTDTPNLGLPLVQAAQAQKHVTVNEALIRLDALSQIGLQSLTQTAPPASIDGLAYGVPAAATGEWAGRDGQIAIGSGGGWVFVQPAVGWRAYVADADAAYEHDGSTWLEPVLSRGATGAEVRIETIEFLHSVSAGTTNLTVGVIPAGTVILAAQARVVEAIGGSLSAWSLGVAGATSQFGSGLGLPVGSFAEGLLGSPTTYYSDTELVLTADGGDFATGEVQFAIHGFRFTLPSI